MDDFSLLVGDDSLFESFFDSLLGSAGEDFVPGDGTDMHYHANPETFLVVSGSGVVKGIKGEERPIQKNEVVFFAAKDYYQITNKGTEPLVLFGNRSEPFGGPHIKDDGTDRNARA